MSKENQVKIKLGYFTYDLIFRRETDDDCGKTDLHEKVIYINTRFNEECQKETLLHELLHVALEDCPLWDNTPEKSGDMEEAIIRFISPRLMEFISHNEFLKDFLWK